MKTTIMSKPAADVGELTQALVHALSLIRALKPEHPFLPDEIYLKPVVKVQLIENTLTDGSKTYDVHLTPVD